MPYTDVTHAHAANCKESSLVAGKSKVCFKAMYAEGRSGVGKQGDGAWAGKVCTQNSVKCYGSRPSLTPWLH